MSGCYGIETLYQTELENPGFVFSESECLLSAGQPFLFFSIRSNTKKTLHHDLAERFGSSSLGLSDSAASQILKLLWNRKHFKMLI